MNAGDDFSHRRTSRGPCRIDAEQSGEPLIGNDAVSGNFPVPQADDLGVREGQIQAVLRPAARLTAFDDLIGRRGEARDALQKALVLPLE